MRWSLLLVTLLLPFQTSLVNAQVVEVVGRAPIDGEIGRAHV